MRQSAPGGWDGPENVNFAAGFAAAALPKLNTGLASGVGALATAAAAAAGGELVAGGGLAKPPMIDGLAATGLAALLKLKPPLAAGLACDMKPVAGCAPAAKLKDGLAPPAGELPPAGAAVRATRSESTGAGARVNQPGSERRSSSWRVSKKEGIKEQARGGHLGTGTRKNKRDGALGRAQGCATARCLHHSLG